MIDILGKKRSVKYRIDINKRKNIDVLTITGKDGSITEFYGKEARVKFRQLSKRFLHRKNII